jgi:hypothetical protein
MTSVRRPPAVLARLAVTVLAGGSILLATGCQSPRAVNAKAVVFSIQYANDCPGMPTSSSPCDGSPDCAKVTGGDATVEFKATGPGAESREFKVQFDPFRETGLESHGGGTTGPVRIPKAHTGSNLSPKVFTFFVVDKKKLDCPLVDPRIIVEN